VSRLGIQLGPAGAPASHGWALDSLAGRFAELSGPAAGAVLTAAVSLIHQSQMRGEPAVWIAVGDSTFFPPDVAASGVDLDALPVVRVTDTAMALRAADHLLRCGGFGVVVIDLGHQHTIRIAAQSRLAGLARRHRSVLLCLTRKTAEQPSIGSLVSLRGEAKMEKISFDRYAWELCAIKDKRNGPGWRHSAPCRGPAGLC
jgi:recombination protein RecA